MNNENYVEIGVLLVELSQQLIVLKQYLSRRRKKFKRWWSKPLIRQNYLTGYGGYAMTFQYFQLHDEEQFINFTRMNVQTYMYVYDLVRERLVKRSIRPALPPELRFSLTLNYLAHGDSIRKHEWFYNIGLSTVKQVIPEVCTVLCEVLMPLFLQYPSRQQFQVIANELMEDLYFPNCIGVLDGKHCKINKPPGSGSLFFNFENFYSIVLMAVCDSKKKRFIWANIGDYGSCNDASIFAENDFGHALLNNEIELPPSQPLPNTQIQSPYVLIGDGGFPLKSNLMKPFIRNGNMTIPHRVFNYRLSHARRIIESAFGELTERWLVNESNLKWKLTTSERIIMSSLCLHNVIKDFQYNEVGNRWNNNHRIIPILQHEDINRDQPLGAHRIREQFCEYFITPAGSVPWQWARI
ncbi:putative nuclease HARBI1 [Nasonia vitripennis]|uniref:DDE Tnp4 domain-containing protein n=1 Tax=Nasonia vitripennis TaxID=7425 RepID=A0A7M7Q7F8_NASVI|nr:putative nuclease HARBI1 [Nasonia vitripennis]